MTTAVACNSYLGKRVGANWFTYYVPCKIESHVPQDLISSDQ